MKTNGNLRSHGFCSGGIVVSGNYRYNINSLKILTVKDCEGENSRIGVIYSLYFLSIMPVYVGSTGVKDSLVCVCCVCAVNVCGSVYAHMCISVWRPEDNFGPCLLCF